MLLPSQTPALALHDVQTAIATGVSHISAYHLNYGTQHPFWAYPTPHLPLDEAAQDIEDIVHQTLIHHGFQHYETSAFARVGKPVAIISTIGNLATMWAQVRAHMAKFPIIATLNAPHANATPTTILPPCTANPNKP